MVSRIDLDRLARINRQLDGADRLLGVPFDRPVRGYWRRYANGTAVWVAGYWKARDRPRVEQQTVERF